MQPCFIISAVVVSDIWIIYKEKNMEAYQKLLASHLDKSYIFTTLVAELISVQL
jgi:hypothetical protein